MYNCSLVGESYVAVSGLPKACPNHAAVMARFACDCLRLLPDILRDIAEANGETLTVELQLRIGLNSGSTTGGILRGSNFSRFQLLGETVSTAAALQRAGVAGRVHVSHSTAHELIEHFKERWLLPREEKVPIGGREMMQTFWLVPEEIQTQGVSSRKASSSTSQSNSVSDSHLVALNDDWGRNE
jgi:class 3 adenylate cyclase